MIAVTDASPLCYLVLIGEIDLLPKVFTRVVVPEAVIRELLHEDAPRAVRDWASDLPQWLGRERLSMSSSQAWRNFRRERERPSSWPSPLGPTSSSSTRRLRAVLLRNADCRLPAHWVCSARRPRGDFWIWHRRLTARRTSFRYSPALLKATLDRFGAGPAKRA